MTLGAVSRVSVATYTQMFDFISKSKYKFYVTFKFSDFSFVSFFGL